MIVILKVFKNDWFQKSALTHWRQKSARRSNRGQTEYNGRIAWHVKFHIRIGHSSRAV